MRWVVGGFAALHGLIHVLGFAKAFGYGDLPLQLPVSRPAGLAWLGCSLLWLTAAGLLALQSERWWLIAAAALAVSQTLIFLAWDDARFGTIANLILAVPVAVAALAASPLGVQAHYLRDTRAALGDAALPDNTSAVAEADIAHLPDTVQRYLRFTNVVGQPRVENYRVRFTGLLRESPGTAWMLSRVTQFSLVHPAGRWFMVTATNKGLPFEALHVYQGAHASFQVRIATFATVVDARGPEMDQSETVTLFNDMCLLAPATLIEADIRWQQVDPSTVRATFTNAGHTISATLRFDPGGALINFVSDDRYRSADGKTYARHRWSTPVMGYARFNGRRVAADAEARWALPDGEFTYARFTLIDAKYNVTSSD